MTPATPPSAIGSRVELRSNDDHRLGHEFFAERCKLPADDFKIVHGVAVGGVAGVDQMREQTGPLDVAKETDAESHAGVRTFNQSGQIGDDKSTSAVSFRRFPRRSVGGNHAEARLKRRERIIGDFRMRGRDSGNQRGLARVRKADQTHIGQQLQLKVQVALLAGHALFGFSRRLMPRLGEVLISASATPALSDQHALARLGQVGNLFAGVLIGDDCANRHQQDHVFASMPGAV